LSTRLILIPTAQTDWRAQGRFAGDTDLSLNEVGHRQALADAAAIAEHHPAAVHSGVDQPARQTAEIIAAELNLKPKTHKALREMDLGHWEALTTDEFRDRFAKVYKMWRNRPTDVQPPEGETVSDVAERLAHILGKLARRHEDEAIVVVLGQFAYAVMRCQLDDDGNYARFWQYVDGDERAHVVTWDAERAAAAPSSTGRGAS